MFTPQFVKGNPNTAFHQQYSIVITETTARKRFGSEQHIVGNTVRQNNNQDFIVSGVMAAKHWGANGVQRYIQRSPAPIPTPSAVSWPDFHCRKKSPGSGKPVLFPMNDWRLRDHFEDGKHLPGGRITSVHLFAGIAWIIIIIACINVLNLWWKNSGPCIIGCNPVKAYPGQSLRSE